MPKNKKQSIHEDRFIPVFLHDVCGLALLLARISLGTCSENATIACSHCVRAISAYMCVSVVFAAFMAGVVGDLIFSLPFWSELRGLLVGVAAPAAL